VAGLALAGAVSVSLALLIAERVVRPGVISEVQTPMLLGLVLLFVLPALTFFAARQDERTAIAESVARRAARRQHTTCQHTTGQHTTGPAAAGRHAELATNSTPMEPDPVLVFHDEDEAEGAGRSIRHGAHDRVQPVPAHRATPKTTASHAE